METEEIKSIKKRGGLVFTIFACIMTGIIVFLASSLGQNIYNSYNPNHSASIKKETCDYKINENDLLEMYNIIGIEDSEQVYFGLNAFLSEINKEMTNLTLDEKKSVIFWYALNHKLITEVENPVTKEKYDGIKISDFDKIKAYYSITEDYNLFFETNMIQNDYVLYNQGGSGSVSLVKHNLSSKSVDNDIVITDNQIIIEGNDSTENKQVIEYKFSKKNKDKYYLVSSTKIQ